MKDSRRSSGFPSEALRNMITANTERNAGRLSARRQRWETLISAAQANSTKASSVGPYFLAERAKTSFANVSVK